MKLVMTRGLPASGKSTWAAAQVLGRAAERGEVQLVDARPGRSVRINKDDLRGMLNAGRHTGGKTEQRIVAARDLLVDMYLGQGMDVIVDDTNLNPVHEASLRAAAARHKAAFHVQDFTHVDVATCIKRDLSRAASVGEKVITTMYEQYLKVNPEPYVGPADADQVILVDIDGTLALMGERSPYTWSEVHLDTPNHPVVAVVRAIAASGVGVVYLSGRDASCRQVTQTWLDEHVGVPGQLLIRPQGAKRKDHIVKRELFEQHIAGSLQVLCVLDDRQQVVDMWRDEAGLTCLQVAPGNF